MVENIAPQDAQISCSRIDERGELDLEGPVLSVDLGPQSGTSHSVITNPPFSCDKRRCAAPSREDVLTQRAVIFRVRVTGPCPGLFVCAGDEGILSGHGEKLALRLGQQVGPVGLKPVALALAPLVLSLAPRNLNGIVDFFDLKDCSSPGCPPASPTTRPGGARDRKSGKARTRIPRSGPPRVEW